LTVHEEGTVMMAQVLLRSLAHRNYRLFFFGQGVSLIGTWMQQIAMSWLVYQLTQSSFQFGLVLFCGQIPALFLAPVAGVLSDRWNRHRLLLLTQSLAMAQAFALAALDYAGVIAVWQVLLLSLFIGVVNAFDMTTRQAFLSEMVEGRDDLHNAIALNSSMVNGARLLGPALGGLLLAQIGAGGCFLLNGISYLAVLAALLAMRLTPRPHPPAHPPLMHGLREGFRYAFGFPPIRALLLMLGLASMAGISYNVLLPEYTDKVLHGDARMLGFLMASSGVGSLAAAVFLASRTTVLGLGKWVMLGSGLMGVALMAFAVKQGLWLTVAQLFVIGFALMIQMASTNSLLQTITDEDMRGRVMSFYTMAFLGMAPIGSLVAGALADWIGTVYTFALNGAACVVGALVFATQRPRLRALVRPIFVRLNIVPEIATGLQAATDLSVPPEHQNA
jgi:MFS family permease